MTDNEHRSDELRDKNPGAGEQTGEAVGGIGGALAGAGIGSAAGPVGTIVGGIAGATGGWWAGEKAGRAVEDMGEHEDHYRDHHRAMDRGLDWQQARIGYTVGHMAGRNPSYDGQSFEAIEPELRSGWRNTDYEYEHMRPHVLAGYARTSKGNPLT